MKLPFDVPHEVRSLRGRDGTEIVYAVAGAGPRDVVMCPGLGGPIVAYNYLFRDLGQRYRFITWEPRGLYRSGVPAGGKASLSMQHHLSDLECIVEAEGLSTFALGGWSMGVQLALEYAFRHPEPCRGLVLLNGFYGRVLDTLGGLGGLERLVVPLVKAGSRAGPALNAAARRVLDHPAFIDLLLRRGLLAANPDFFRVVTGEFKQLEFGRYLQMVLALHEHTAEPFLPSLKLPALVIIGTRDLLAPPKVGRALANRLPNARAIEVSGGTHYALLEFPEIVNRAVGEFLDGLPGWSVRASASNC